MRETDPDVLEEVVKERTAAEQAKHLADDVLAHPITDDQSIELAKVYAYLALVQAMGIKPRAEFIPAEAMAPFGQKKNSKGEK